MEIDARQPQLRERMFPRPSARRLLGYLVFVLQLLLEHRVWLLLLLFFFFQGLYFQEIDLIKYTFQLYIWILIYFCVNWNILLSPKEDRVGFENSSLVCYNSDITQLHYFSERAIESLISSQLLTKEKYFLQKLLKKEMYIWSYQFPNSAWKVTNFLLPTQ